MLHKGEKIVHLVVSTLSFKNRTDQVFVKKKKKEGRSCVQCSLFFEKFVTKLLL